MNNSSLSVLSVLIAVSFILGAHTAVAQTMDYGALEDIFGEPVTTSANGKPQRVSEVSLNMKIVTADDIKRSGSLTIPGILKSVAGMDFISYTNSYEEIAIRGYNQVMNPRLLVTVNGRQVYANFFGFVDWNSIPVELDEIRQIEIVKGPNTALFGLNSASGVINIVTYSPLYDNQNSVRGGIGTDGLLEISGVATAKLDDKAGLRASAGYKESKPFSAEDNPMISLFSENSDTKRGSLDGIIKIGATAILNMEVTGSKSKFNSILLTKDAVITDMKTTSAKIGFETQTSLGMLRLTGYKNWMDYKASAPSTVNPIMDENVGFLQAELLKKIDDRNTVRVATEFRSSVLNNSLAVVSRTPNNEFTQKTYSISGLWDSRITEKLASSISLRWDRQNMSRTGFLPPTVSFTNKDFNHNHSEFSYNLGAVYQLTDTSSFRITTARGIQLPSSVDHTSFIFEPTFGNATIIGSPHLKSSVINNYEVGFDRKIDMIDGLFKIAAFHQKTSNITSSAPVQLVILPSGVPGNIKSNIGDSKAKGFELELEGRTEKNIKWNLNYSYIDVEDDLDNFIDGVLWHDKEFEKQSPNHHFNIMVGYENKNWSLDVLGHYVSGRVDIVGQSIGLPYRQVNVEDSFSVDGRLAFKLNDNVSLDILGTNLLTKTLRLSAHGLTERRIFAQIKMSY